MPETTCEHCKFFKRVGDWGTCHRFPPNNLTEFARSNKWDWCGEFQRKESDNGRH